MKNTSLILSIISLVAVIALGIISFTGKGSASEAKSGENAPAAGSGAIVYFNLDRVLNEYDMANDLRSVVESKAQGIQEEVNRRGNKLQNDVNSFQEKINKGLITRSVAEVQGQKLEQQRNDLLPPSEKKKYTKEHVLTLIFIYYFKNILSISDIQSILNPLTDKYFGNKDGFNMQDIYKEVFSLESHESEKLLKDIAKKFTIAHICG